MMLEQNVLFLFLSGLCIVGGLGILVHPNALICSLFLALVMMALAGIFFLLEAPFLSGVQIIVYAGAVMTLFLMVIMLFKQQSSEKEPSRYSNYRFFLKIFFLGWFCALISLSGLMSVDLIRKQKGVGSGKLGIDFLAEKIFTDYVLAFELLGLLLLVVAVGAVTISRIDEGEGS